MAGRKRCSWWWLETPRFACYARFTLADPMPRLGSDVIGGNSGRNHPTSRRHTIHIGRMARNVSIRVGWYEGVVQYCTTPWLVGWKSLIYYNSQLRCTRFAPDRPAASGNIKHVDGRFRVGRPFTLAEPTASGHNRGIGSANVKRA